MMTMIRSTVALAAFSLCLNLAAAPQQADVLPPGGFVAACAASISSANAMPYGGWLADLWSSPGNAGKYSCDASSFSGAAGLASASAQFAAPNIANTAQGQAGMGRLALSATNSSPGNTYGAQGAANGGWSDRTTVTIAGQSGSAIWLFNVAVSGSLHVNGGAATFGATAYKNNTELQRNVSGFDRGDSDLFTTDRQRVKWGLTAASPTEERSRAVDDIVTFAVPVTLGTPFVWGVYGSLNAGQRSVGTGVTRIETAEIDFSHTLRFAGTAGVLVGGVLLTDYQLASDSGIDWRLATPVPEPGTGALWLAGAAALGWLQRRRRS